MGRAEQGDLTVSIRYSVPVEKCKRTCGRAATFERRRSAKLDSFDSLRYILQNIARKEGLDDHGKGASNSAERDAQRAGKHRECSRCSRCTANTQSNHIDTMAASIDALKLLSRDLSQSRLPVPAEISRLVLAHLDTDLNYSPGQRAAFAQAWTSGACVSEGSMNERVAAMGPGYLEEHQREEKVLYDRAQAAFEAHDLGRHGDMHDRLTPSVCAQP